MEDHRTAPRQRELDAIRSGGGANFRDLGGYPTPDGRTTRWGCVYRSGQLDELAPEAAVLLRDLGVTRIIDFRSKQEREKRPHRLAPDHAVSEYALDLDPGSSQSLRGAFQNVDLTPEAASEMMSELNRLLVREHAPAFRVMFEALGEADPGARLVMCAAGKDRTGVASALFLAALGVDRDVIRHDYLLTNRYRSSEERFVRTMRDHGRLEMAEISREVMERFRGVRPEYIDAAFDEIDTHLGGLAAYFRDALGLSDSRRDALRARFLA